MKGYTLKVPRTDYNLEWMRFGNVIFEFGFQRHSNITVDFGTINFLSPAQFVLLTCIVEHLYVNFECIISFVGGTRFFNQHLENIKFRNYWTSDFSREDFTPSYNNTTLCPWHISKNMIDQYGQQTQKYFSKRYFYGKDLQPLAHSLVEVFNNIFDHAQSPIHGYVITQYFPNLNKLTFAVCDFGQGIPTSINRFLSLRGDLPLEENLAIEKALERGMTIKSVPNNAGFGLSNVLDFTENSNGQLSIFSNAGYYIKKYDVSKKSGILSYPFNGTLIVVDIDTTTFDDFDSEDEIYEF